MTQPSPGPALVAAPPDYPYCGRGTGLGDPVGCEEDEALKKFTHRVEQHRNEQRRRQKQLDQPADQATPSGQPPAA